MISMSCGTPDRCFSGFFGALLFKEPGISRKQRNVKAVRESTCIRKMVLKLLIIM